MSAIESNLSTNVALCPLSIEMSTKVSIAWLANTPLRDARLRKLLRLIEADPLGNIQDWAVALNLSNAHLQHLFKKETGVALGHALAETRLQKAAELLATTNLRIREIACGVGYVHTSSFTRAFGKRFEQTPHRFRTNNAV